MLIKKKINKKIIEKNAKRYNLRTYWIIPIYLFNFYYDNK